MTRRDGQAMLEYILVFTALIVLVAMLILFVRGTKRAAERTAILVSSENA